MKKKQRKFNIGDRVKPRSEGYSHGSCTNACVGTVTWFAPYEPRVGVKFDKKHRGAHDLDGHCRNEYGWYLYEEDLMLLKADVKKLKKQKPITVPSMDKYKAELGL